MLKSPTNESPETSRASRTVATPEPRRELHPPAPSPALGLVSRLSGARLERSNAALQSAIGNQGMLRLLSLSAPAIQPELTINEPGDRYEQEADRVAEQVMRMPDPAAVPPPSQFSGTAPGPQRNCENCDNKERIQRKNTGSSPATAPPIVHQVLRSPGRPLDSATRTFFEPRFGSDFSGVRVHSDSRAADSARALNALAYTVGSHIVFANGQYAPHSASGQRLVAHELVHVGQQRRASSGLAASGEVGLQRQGVPQTQPQSTDDKDQKPDDPQAWLTLQAQPFLQYQRIYTIPKPPPWLLGGQLAANLQFHSDGTGFELAVLGQYGHIFTWNSKATAGGDQWQVGLQPSYVLVNAKVFKDRSTQLALIAQGAYASTSSLDPTVSGQQISLVGGAQVTQDIAQLGPFKLQGVASAEGGAAWSKAPADTGFSAAGEWQVQVGFQVALDTVKRKRKPPPAQNVETTITPEERVKEREQEIKDRQSREEQQKEEQQKKEAELEARKKIDEQPKKPTPPPPPPLPQDLRIFFLEDKPLHGFPSDTNVIAGGMGGDDLNAAKALVQATLAADPAVRVSISGYASIEAPSKQYNCDLGSRRSEWIRRQLGIPIERVADLPDKAPEICADNAGLISFGSNKAADTKNEAERSRDRFVIVHFQR